MSNETVVRLTGDASGYVSELERARKSAADFVTSQETVRQRLANSVSAIESTRNALKAQGDEAVAAFSKTARSAEGWLTSLQKQADQAGKTRAQLMELRAAELGVSDAAQPYIDKIKAAEAAMTSGGHAAEGLNLSTVAARRELLVLAHEMSQGSWKNFGGSLLVLGERIDAMSLIFSAAGVSAAALAAGVVAVAVAAVKGAEEMKQFNAALTLTSNYAGLTRESLEAMAHSVSNSSGASLSRANEVLLDLAKSGKYTSDEMSLLAGVILRTAQISGESLKDVGKEYEKLAEDPAKWAAEHNASMHFMDVATYQHIKALEDAGDKHKALQAVIEAAAAQVEDSSNKHLSAAAQAWRSLSNEVQTFWDKMKQGLSSGPNLQDRIDTLKEQRAAMVKAGGGFTSHSISDVDQQIANLEAFKTAQDRYAKQQADNAQKQQAAVEAEQRVDKMRDQIMTNAQKREKELALLARDRSTVLAGGGKFSDADYSKMVADINEKYKDPKQARPKAYTDDAATRFLQQLRDQGAELQAQLSATDKLTNSERELAKFNQQISDWKGKTLTADQKSLIVRQDQIRSQLQSNVELEKEKVHRDDIAKLQERSAQIQASIASYQKGQTDQYARQLDAFGMGSEALKNVQAVKSIYAEYQRLQEQLDKATPKDALNSDEYKQASAKIKAGLDQSLKDYDAYYSALKDRQADWENGAMSGLANYLDSARNVATQAESAFTNAAKGMEDALTNFVMTGKLNFTSLANSIIADIVRMQARAAMSGLFNSLAGLFSAGIAGSFGTLATTGAAAGAASDVMGAGYSAGLTGPSSVMPTYASLPGRADGGPVTAGQAYWVGERGPEPFVPSQSGTIIPNHALGGGGVSVQIVNNSSAHVQQPQVSQDASGQRFIRLVIDQAKNEIAGEMAGGQGNVSKALTQRYGLTPRFR